MQPSAFPKFCAMCITNRLVCQMLSHLQKNLIVQAQSLQACLLCNGISGRACRALQISLAEVQNELVYSAASYAILGRSGVVLINCIIFMAVTSSGSGEMLAVSSLFTFDFYREYLRPRVCNYAVST